MQTSTSEVRVTPKNEPCYVRDAFQLLQKNHLLPSGSWPIPPDQDRTTVRDADSYMTATLPSLAKAWLTECERENRSVRIGHNRLTQSLYTAGINKNFGELDKLLPHGFQYGIHKASNCLILAKNCFTLIVRLDVAPDGVAFTPE